MCISAAENRPNLESHAERRVASCAATGYLVHQVVNENGSGANDCRPKVLDALADPAIPVIVVEQKDQATRIGFRYLEMLLE